MAARGLYKVSTGQPFTPIFGGDPYGTKLDETSEVPSYSPGCNPVERQFQKEPEWPHLSQCELLYSPDRSEFRVGIAAVPMRDVLRGFHTGPEWPDVLYESPRQPGPQHGDWARTVEARLLSFQEQSRKADLGRFQCAVPGRDFQYSESREFFFADGQYECVRWKREPGRQRGAAHFDANIQSANSVRSEVDLVTLAKGGPGRNYLNAEVR